MDVPALFYVIGDRIKMTVISVWNTMPGLFVEAASIV